MSTGFEQIDQQIAKSNAGDQESRQQLFDLVYARLQGLARKMLKGFPGVRRWEETDDVWQNASLKLWKALGQLEINDSRHFYALAAVHIRRELIDLARRHFGPLGMGANQSTREINPDASSQSFFFEGQDVTYEASRLSVWSEFHEQVGKLDDDERETFDLIWYQGLPQSEVARIIGVSERTVKRRWQAARLNLANSLSQMPE